MAGAHIMEAKTPTTLFIWQQQARIRLRLVHGEQVVLRATLPQPASYWTSKPVNALLESLAIWLDTHLHVALDVADEAAWYSRGLIDELGIGYHTVFYDVAPIRRRRRQRRGALPAAPDCQASVTTGGAP
jgi:hypothetical protein